MRAIFMRLASRPIPRVTRVMSVARESGFACLFVGAARDLGLERTDRWEDFEIERVGRAFPLVNGGRPLTYLRGVLSYGAAAIGLIRRERPAFIHASDFEAGVPALIAGRLFRIPVMYNIHDNLSMRYSLPRPLVGALNIAEGLLVRAAAVTVVPEPFRRDALPSWARDAVQVVRNSPDDPGYTAPSAVVPVLPRVLFAGWLDRGRALLEVIGLARAGQIQLVVAGEGDDAIRAALRTTPNIEYRGFCNHGEIIELTRSCDYVAAFYDPARAINRYAASNKIAEALAVGRPVLTNRELLVADALQAAGVGIIVPYADITSIGPSLRAHLLDRTAYIATCQRARRLYEADYHSSQVRQATLTALSAVGLNLGHRLHERTA